MKTQTRRHRALTKSFKIVLGMRLTPVIIGFSPLATLLKLDNFVSESIWFFFVAIETFFNGFLFILSIFGLLGVYLLISSWRRKSTLLSDYIMSLYLVVNAVVTAILISFVANKYPFFIFVM